jgi:repressor LexA
MGRDSLTKRQKQILDFIMEQTQKSGYPPTVREIGEAVGLSSSATVHTHLSALEAKGYLHRDASKSRSISVIGAPGGAQTRQEAMRDTVVLPVVGRVAAGQPILAEQNIEDTLVLPSEIVGDSSSFLLRVKGDSMVEAGIFEGDYVVVREQQTATNGEIVVALIGDEATVKTFYREKEGRVRLQPENHTMDPIYPDPAELSIIGRVVALFRTI